MQNHFVSSSYDLRTKVLQKLEFIAKSEKITDRNDDSLSHNGVFLHRTSI